MPVTREAMLLDVFRRALSRAFDAAEGAEGGIDEDTQLDVDLILSAAEGEALDDLLSRADGPGEEEAGEDEEASGQTGQMEEGPEPSPTTPDGRTTAPRPVTLSALGDSPDPPDAPSRAEEAALEVLGEARKLARGASSSLTSLMTSSDPARATGALAGWVEAWRPRLASLLSEARLLGALRGALDAAELLDRGEQPDWQAPLEPEDWGRDPEGPYRLALVDEAASWLAGSGALAPPELAALASRARESADRQAAREADAVASRVRAAVARAVEQGSTLEEFRRELKQIPARTFLDPRRSETVFRTSVMQAYAHGQERLLSDPEVSNLYPYRLYSATHDPRTRPEHLAMERRGIQGTAVYRAEDPVFKLFAPPSGYNCRCVATPITVRQAAALGVREAQDWLATGHAPVRPAWVDMPPWRPDPGFGVTLALGEGQGECGEYEGGEGGEGGEGEGYDLARGDTDPANWERWQVRRGPRKGQWVWRNVNTHRLVEGERPGTTGVASTLDAAGRRKGVRAKPREERASVEDTEKQVKALLEGGEVTAEKVGETVESLLSLSVKDLRELRQRLMVKASGRKLEMARKIVERAARKGREQVTEEGKEAPDTGTVERSASDILRDASAGQGTSQKRAAVGGEYGPNGDWYPGGAFIATTEMPKQVRQKLQRLGEGRGVEVEPGKRETPGPGRMAIYDKLQPGWLYDPRAGDFLRSAQPWRDLDERERAGYESLLSRYRGGERWASVVDHPELASPRDVARMVAAGQAVPGAAMDRLPAELQAHMKKWAGTSAQGQPESAPSSIDDTSSTGYTSSGGEKPPEEAMSEKKFELPKRANGEIVRTGALSAITYRPTSGPLAGAELRGGFPKQHPEVGQVVVYTRAMNQEAFQKAKLPANVHQVTVRVDDKPDLAELVADLGAEESAYREERRRERHAEWERTYKEPLERLEREEAELVARIPADHLRVEAKKTGDLDGDPIYEYSVQGVKVPWNLPGVVRHGTASATLPGAMNPFEVRDVRSVSRADFERWQAGEKAKRDEEQARQEEKRRAKQEKESAALERARATGQPVPVEHWTELVDDEANENSLDVVTRYVRPDGTFYTRRTPTH